MNNNNNDEYFINYYNNYPWNNINNTYWNHITNTPINPPINPPINLPNNSILQNTIQPDNSINNIFTSDNIPTFSSYSNQNIDTSIINNSINNNKNKELEKIENEMKILNKELVDMLQKNNNHDDINYNLLPLKYVDASTDTSSIPSQQNNDFINLINKYQLKVEQTPQNSNINKDKWKINKDNPINTINQEINTINDLIKIGKLYEDLSFGNKNYSVNIEGIYKMIPVLKEFDSLIGLDQIKERILDQIIFFSQDLHNNYLNKNNDNISEDNFDMFHTVIEGSPGVGKTILGKILSKIYLALGITCNDTFKVVKRSDLIAEYLGQTAIKTQKVIDSVAGGVLFIDEAYSLGNDNETDSYSKECLDVLNQNLSENKSKFICIIAGYPEDLEKNFFSANKGLREDLLLNILSKNILGLNLLKYLFLKLIKILLMVTGLLILILING